MARQKPTRGAPELVMGPCIVEIDLIVIRDVKYQFPYKEKCPAHCGHVFQATGTNFELVQNIIGTNLLTKFHDDHTINMASRVLTGKNATPPWQPYIIGTNHLTKFHDDRTINVAYRVLTSHITKNAPPPDIIRTNLLTKFHEDRKINLASRKLTRKKCPAPWRP
ncbi:hypothetical protein DPMN_066209, partial [Dreissena polymorpha]